MRRPALPTPGGWAPDPPFCQDATAVQQLLEHHPERADSQVTRQHTPNAEADHALQTTITQAIRTGFLTARPCQTHTGGCTAPPDLSAHSMMSTGTIAERLASWLSQTVLDLRARMNRTQIQTELATTATGANLPAATTGRLNQLLSWSPHAHPRRGAACPWHSSQPAAQTDQSDWWDGERHEQPGWKPQHGQQHSWVYRGRSGNEGPLTGLLRGWFRMSALHELQACQLQLFSAAAYGTRRASWASRALAVCAVQPGRYRAHEQRTNSRCN